MRGNRDIAVMNEEREAVLQKQRQEREGLGTAALGLLRRAVESEDPFYLDAPADGPFLTAARALLAKVDDAQS
jgi:hypothetical protein